MNTIHVTKRLAARRYTHVLGHNFAPFAFQKPRLGLLTEQIALYTFSWFSERSRTLGRDEDVTDMNGIGVRSCVHPPQRGGLR